jgi:hypothetical protein
VAGNRGNPAQKSLSAQLALSYVLDSRCEVLAFDVWRQNHLDECIAEKELILAVIESEAPFVHVSLEKPHISIRLRR